MQRSLRKCQSDDELVFMEQELGRLFQRCRERGILFTRDWLQVTEPSLVRESPMNYQRLNELIRDNDQGVVKRVQQEVLNHAQSLTGAKSSIA